MSNPLLNKPIKLKFYKLEFYNGEVVEGEESILIFNNDHEFDILNNKEVNTYSDKEVCDMWFQYEGEE